MFNCRLADRKQVADDDDLWYIWDSFIESHAFTSKAIIIV